jgi:Peptidase M61 N-terminal domain
MVRMATVLACAALSFCRPAFAGSPSAHPYSGELSLKVDLAHPGQKIFRVDERIRVSAGAVTLYYPKWIPGEHSPSGPIDAVTGLKITT